MEHTKRFMEHFTLLFFDNSVKNNFYIRCIFTYDLATFHMPKRISNDTLQGSTA